MNSKMTVIMALCGVATVCAAVGTARAGWKYTGNTLVINASAREAFGAMGDIRSSADGGESLQCTLNSTTTALSMQCQGVDISGNTFSCVSSEAPLVSALQSLRNDDYVQVGWNASGYCTYLNLTSGTEYAPKTL